MRLSAVHGSIASDHFLMNLLRTQIPLGAVVGWGNITTMQEEKDGGGILAETSLKRPFLPVLPGSIFGIESIPLLLHIRHGPQPPSDP